MEDHKNFYKNKEEQHKFGIPKQEVIRDKDGFVHITMASTIFHEVGQSLLASNSTFANLLDDIQPCVEPYSTKEKIVIDVFETQDSDEFSRASTISGFRKYVNGCLAGLMKQHYGRFFLFFTFLILGVIIESMLYGVVNFVIGDYNQFHPFWLFKCIEVLGTLFIWQFGGYLAFEFLGEIKNIKRYRQIANIKFNFKHWD